MSRKILNLESTELADADVVIQYRGVMVRLDRRRILELIDLEDQWLRGAAPSAGGPVATAAPRSTKAPVAASTGPSGIAGDLNPGPASHASLSYRIKRVYNFSKASQTLRETHRGLILELVDRFDWIIPDHPNSQLDFHLREIVGWIAGKDAHAEEKIKIFLERYQEARYRSGSAS